MPSNTKSNGQIFFIKTTKNKNTENYKLLSNEMHKSTRMLCMPRLRIINFVFLTLICYKILTFSPWFIMAIEIKDQFNEFAYTKLRKSDSLIQEQPKSFK